MSVTLAPKHISIEEYLLMEDEAEERHEYYKGEVFAMAGGTMSHTRIIRNATTLLDTFLTGKECEVFPTELKVHNPANTLFTYPDLSIVCGDLEPWNERNDIITNPTVLIEVLSKSTQRYDRGDKFLLYRSIPTLKEYILISSLEVLLEQYTKQSNGSWTFNDVSNTEAFLQIESIHFSCPIKDLYRNVSFE